MSTTESPAARGRRFSVIALHLDFAICALEADEGGGWTAIGFYVFSPQGSFLGAFDSALEASAYMRDEAASRLCPAPLRSRPEHAPHARGLPASARPADGGDCR